MPHLLQHRHHALALSVLAAASLAACGGGNDNVVSLPQLKAATSASLAACTDLAGKFAYPNVTIAAANAVAAGTLTVAGKPVPAHCQVTGKLLQRTSTVDGRSYAIGFEMRLPNAWNGRFFYQANGGTDGSVLTATGLVGGGGPLDNALNQGFAVI
ncbi:MAG: tannase/feruloyl esterase family alpha/beta hydrolase, partial [Burkholderiaceae bacterium]